MHPAKRTILAINLLGGGVVLASYFIGSTVRQDAGQVLWGGVPESLRSYYTLGMFLAAAGYFVFSLFILRLNPAEVKVGQWKGYRLFNPRFTAILIPSALWLPLSLWAIDRSSPGLTWLVRLELAVVALASIGLAAALTKVQPRQPLWAQRSARLGALAFCFQTVLLDAIVRGLFFRP